MRGVRAKLSTYAAKRLTRCSISMSSNPERAIIKVQSYLPATNMLAQTTLRAVLGQHELEEMLSEQKNSVGTCRASSTAKQKLGGSK